MCLEICTLVGCYTALSGNGVRKDYHLVLCNTPEERRSHEHRGGSLKSRIHAFCSKGKTTLLQWAFKFNHVLATAETWHLKDHADG
jgi:hypothetical protein